MVSVMLNVVKCNSSLYERMFARNGDDKGRKRFVDLLNHDARSPIDLLDAVFIPFFFFLPFFFLNKNDEEFSYTTKLYHIIRSDSSNLKMAFPKKNKNQRKLVIVIVRISDIN